MKCLLLILTLALFAGCATHKVAQEDKDFFWKGWWNPEQASQERMGFGDKPKKGYDPEIPGGLL